MALVQATDYKIYHNGAWVSVKNKPVRICAGTVGGRENTNDWRFLADSRFNKDSRNWYYLAPFVTIPTQIFIEQGELSASIAPTAYNANLTGFTITGTSPYVRITTLGLTITATKLVGSFTISPTFTVTPTSKKV